MALILENGTGLVNSQTYATHTELQAYADARGITIQGSQTQLEHYLVNAMDYLESLRSRFQGSKVSANQALQFPRTGVTIDGIELESSVIPTLLKSAQMRAAIEVHNGIDLMPTQAGQFAIEETVGPITTKYSEKIGVSAAPTILALEALLEPLFKASSSVGMFLKTVRV